jgi:Holliday junction resolvase RusA-like endonuclease
LKVFGKKKTPRNSAIHFPRPKTHYGHYCAGEYRPLTVPQTHLNHLQTPNVDHLGKFVLDALNGLAYEDNKYVVELCMAKQWIGQETHHMEVLWEDLAKKGVQDGYISLTIQQQWAGLANST